jgi:hypothetical protein
MAKNLMGKSRKADAPYMVFTNDQGWTWKVLKSWQGDDSKQFARWFTDVSSPMTFGGSDMGDTYVADVVNYGTLVFMDDVLKDAGYAPPARGSVKNPDF